MNKRSLFFLISVLLCAFCINVLIVLESHKPRWESKKIISEYEITEKKMGKNGDFIIEFNYDSKNLYYTIYFLTNGDITINIYRSHVSRSVPLAGENGKFSLTFKKLDTKKWGQIFINGDFPITYPDDFKKETDGEEE